MMTEVCGTTSLIMTEVNGAMIEMCGATSHIRMEVWCYQSYVGSVVLLVI